jgi:hypothetical protein
MTRGMTSLIFLLVAALFIQNTCPHGFAGKSTVAASCSHCPHKHTETQAMEGKAFSSISPAPVHLPMYVLDIPDTKPVFRLEATTSPQPAIPNTYKNTATDELLQPPRA